MLVRRCVGSSRTDHLAEIPYQARRCPARSSKQRSSNERLGLGQSVRADQYKFVTMYSLYLSVNLHHYELLTLP